MPIVFEDNHRCEKCMRRFNWIYFKSARSKLGSGLPVAETLPTLPAAYRVEPLENDTYKIFISTVRIVVMIIDLIIKNRAIKEIPPKPIKA